MKTIKVALGLFLLILICSCEQKINPDEILNKEKDFKLTVHLKDINSSDSTKVVTINKDSEKIAKLKNWISINSDGWKSSFVSCAPPNISLIGTDFRLLIYRME